MGIFFSFKRKDSASQPPSTTPVPAQIPTFYARSASISDMSARDPSSESHDSTNPSVYSGHTPELPDSAGLEAIRDIKCDILVNWLYTKQEEKLWTCRTAGEGVFVKKSKGNYACAPPPILSDGSNLYHSITELNARCALTVNSRIVRFVLSRTEVPYVQIRSGLRLQVIPDIEALPYCQRAQSAAFIASNQLLVVWQDDPKALVDRAEMIINSLMRMSCGDEFGFPDDDELDEITGKTAWTDIAEYHDVVEHGEDKMEDHRELKLWQSLYTGLSLILLVGCIGFGFRDIAVQQVLDPNWLRLLFLLVTPAQIWFSLFFFQAIVGNIAQVAGPTGQMNENSKYYSGKAPRRLHRDTLGAKLPHVTVQMPVYREGLRGVIEPTVRSVKQAISTYELQGGTANIFVNDDGMQLISADDARERQEFYDENGIGWVARPKHNPYPEPGAKKFLRRGKFKKASNMNYGMRLSVRVEELLADVERTSGWTQLDENEMYKNALLTAMNERKGEAWADGIIRMGDYILLIDSDTRVPVDCLLEAVSEMETSTQVAILQYSSGVMSVTESFFERGITFFTNMIYTSIRFGVAGGDVAPFVGHNAILRWSALQKVAYECESDHWEKYWSESTVSEDFDMSLRLQSEGYTVRLGGYKGDGYKEGVSLTVYDELARWEKYAYGCNELLFHPFRDWIFKGPLTPVFKSFLLSSMPLPFKITILAYIGTYYAIGTAWILTCLNYFLIGFFNGALDSYYLPSIRVYLAIVFVFSIMGNFALAVLRYRIEEGELIRGLITNIKWIPLMTVFLGGVSLHVSEALICHFFSIDMEWGSTTKEAENMSFFTALKRVARKFKGTFVFCFIMTAVMIATRFALAEDWQIKEFVAVYPMAIVVVTHALLPVVLNPQLMTFTW